jgi:alpha-mannosidase
MGRHEFAYAVMPHAGGWREAGVVAEAAPHAGGWREAGVVAEAARFNSPVRWGIGSGESGSPAEVEGGLVLDTIKRAEDSDAIVLRLYEPHGARGFATIRLARPFASARLANLLEDDGDPVEVEDGTIRVPFRPHEIVTLKVA